ncbi:Helix-turn-helix domain-containing protein [Deinococcus reticulitermitis]|uniref:Helix-turn-helix domain-containing protein n=1 Tax=Deinococcus reticulitermitis TaxID=856736 RepID=A0A1H7BTQ7_9DEIO|nr:helix-turn-helix transcriptional regulator [Deinococcus reticulitermitis]SEJ79717.1 Helix-turn-helix domain-containing protein [Deinococcus reticulitermitis]
MLTDQDDLIRQRIRARMAERGLTQAQLARQLGIKPPSLAQVLSGRRGRIPESLLTVLAALELHIEILPALEKQDG